jgi:hypothetical protein
MFEERVEDPEQDDSVAVDPPNNTEDGSSMSSADNEAASPVDPPNNT